MRRVYIVKRPDKPLKNKRRSKLDGRLEKDPDMHPTQLISPGLTVEST